MEGFHDGNDIRLTAPAIRRRRCLSGSGSKRITVDRQNAGWRPSLCKPLTLQPGCGEEGTEAFPPEASVHNHGSCSTVPGIPGAGFFILPIGKCGGGVRPSLIPPAQKIAVWRAIHHTPSQGTGSPFPALLSFEITHSEQKINLKT